MAYDFDQAYTVSGVEVYWLDFDHYDGNFRVPASWRLYYKDGDSWKEVEATTPYTTTKDTYNRLDFKPVKTTGLKIAAQLQKVNRAACWNGRSFRPQINYKIQ